VSECVPDCPYVTSGGRKPCTCPVPDPIMVTLHNGDPGRAFDVFVAVAFAAVALLMCGILYLWALA
jgi:hypothetical protein